MALKLDCDRGNLATPPTGPGTYAFGPQLIQLARVREDAQGKLGGSSALSLNQRMATCSWLAWSSRQQVTSEKPAYSLPMRWQ